LQSQTGEHEGVELKQVLCRQHGEDPYDHPLYEIHDELKRKVRSAVFVSWHQQLELLTFSHAADTVLGIAAAVFSMTPWSSDPRLSPRENPLIIAVEMEVLVNADRSMNHQK